MNVTNEDQGQHEQTASRGRRTFLGASASALAGGIAVLSAPFVKAQGKTTIRFLNSETSTESQAVLRKAGSEYESLFGVKIVVDSTPISGAFPKSMAAINAGSPYDIATMGFIADILQYARGGHLIPLTDLVKKHSWGQMGS